MDAADAGLKFPVLGFTRDEGMWGFEDLNTLTSCGPLSVKEATQVGMELVDAKGRRWVVTAMRRVGRGEPLLLWLLSCVLSTRQSRVELQLDPLEPVTLDEVKARAVRALEIEDEDSEEDFREEHLYPLLAKVRAAKSVSGVFRLVLPDSFMAY